MFRAGHGLLLLTGSPGQRAEGNQGGWQRAAAE